MPRQINECSRQRGFAQPGQARPWMRRRGLGCCAAVLAAVACDWSATSAAFAQSPPGETERAAARDTAATVVVEARNDSRTGSAEAVAVRAFDLAVLDNTYAPMRAIIERFQEDERAYQRAFQIPMSQRSRDSYRNWLETWQGALRRVDFAALDPDGRIDFLLLDNELRHRQDKLESDSRREQEIADLVPFAPEIVRLLEQRQRMEPLAGPAAAQALALLEKAVVAAGKRVESGEIQVSRPVANRGWQRIQSLRAALRTWHQYYEGYDPLYTWWAKRPFASVEAALESYAAKVRDKLVGVPTGSADDIIGDPLGKEALLRELAYEMIPYSPEELIEIANREFAWCDREMLQASRELGFGENWQQALEQVKNHYVPPGQQPALIRELALEAVQFLDNHDLVSIPALCRSSWRIEMMTPDRQRVNPYFTGGEVISVSFPTDTMTQEEKEMSLRSNNRHFCRATVHHELMPGHHLQLFMADRYRSHRKLFTTPFLIEGWALHWEMLLWDMRFAPAPGDRVGMLFWRMHRCARIILSLGFHLQQQQPAEMIAFLVDRVGHERSAAEAEVRRWVAGDYGPLYQAAYMLGGLQIRSLHRDFVQSGRMTNREFHDAILRQNAIPIDMIRLSLSREMVERDYRTTWRFYPEGPLEP